MSSKEGAPTAAAGGGGASRKRRHRSKRHRVATSNQDQHHQQQRPSKKQQHSPTNSAASKISNNAIQNANDKMTPHAVRTMLLADAYQEPLVVALWCTFVAATAASNFQLCHVFDTDLVAPVLVATDQLRRLGIIPTIPQEHEMPARMIVVQVTGYITSTVNASGTTCPAFQPFLCLTSLQLVVAAEGSPQQQQQQQPSLSDWCKGKTMLNAPTKPGSTPDKSKVPGGTSAAMVKAHLDSLAATTTTTTSSGDDRRLGRMDTVGDIMGGDCAGIISSASPTTTARMELQPRAQRPSHEHAFDDNHASVQEFLVHHKAMKTLADYSNFDMMILHNSRSRSNSAVDDAMNDRAAADTKINHGSNDNESNDSAGIASSSRNNETTTSHPQRQSANNSPTNSQQQQQPQHELYFSALKEFSQSQIDRQTASLTSNAGKATAKVAFQVVQQHQECHDQVMTAATKRHGCRRSAPSQEQQQQGLIMGMSAPWITVANIKVWHETLCGRGLHANAGNFRTNNVKAGRTVFRPASQVVHDLQHDLLPALTTLEERLRPLPPQQEALACLTYAAAVFFGLVDLHAFSDGNGRLARLLGNGALRAMGLPFCVNWFATPAQRREYVLATLMTRRNLTLVYRGEQHDGDKGSQLASMQDAMAAAGMYYPLVALLMDRVRKAIPEFIEIQYEKQLSLMDSEEAKAARRVRERAAAGSCLICFDDHPNIATLCCGKAVHLNCIAEWLSNNSSCPNCRGNLPTVPQRPARATIVQLNDDNLDDELDRASMEEEDDFDATTDDTISVDGNDPNDTAGLIRSGLVNFFLAGGGRGDDDANDEDVNEDTADDTTEDDNQDDGGGGANGEDIETTDEPAEESQANGNDEDDTTADDTLYDTESVGVGSNDDNPRTGAEQDHTGTDDTTDDTDDTVVDDGPDADGSNTSDYDTNSVTDSTESTGAPNNNNPPVIDCDHCRNRAAQECTNTCCGRCCILHGEWECTRHRASSLGAR